MQPSRGPVGRRTRFGMIKTQTGLKKKKKVGKLCVGHGVLLVDFLGCSLAPEFLWIVEFFLFFVLLLNSFLSSFLLEP